jgi:hypothetical protein
MLRLEHKTQGVGERVLMSIFESKMEEATGEQENYMRGLYFFK